MSAKGRGTKVEPFEYYATPAKAVHQLLRAVPLAGGQWLEPGAGSGSIIQAVNKVRGDVTWAAAEIQKRFERKLIATGAQEVMIGNYLRMQLPDVWDVALGNPPFSLASHFVDRSLRCCQQVILLLRLNWLGSSTRRRWVFERYGVPDVFVLADRPSFVGQGTDATDYAWMRWKRSGQKGTTQIIWGKP